MVEHALIAMMPFHMLCDRWDLGGLSTTSSSECQGKPVIFIYDGYEGGIGLAERAYHIYEEALPVIRVHGSRMSMCRWMSCLYLLTEMWE